jgi:TolB-like protein/DNA-binding winged helix-turn-helix (wHTH) protein
MQQEPVPRTGHRNFQLGPWRVEPDLDRINGTNGIFPLQPKAMAVLVYLAERQGRVVSTDELVDAIWQGRPMGDNPVYKCIAQLRTLLGDDRKDPSYISTVHTKGYLLLAPVDWLDRDTAEVAHGNAATVVAEPRGRMRMLAWTAALATGLLATFYFVSRDDSERPAVELAASADGEQASIAVLPFANMSPGAGQDYFADGLTEELITQLAKLPGIRVIGRTSSFAFKGKDEDLRTIGRTLGVNHVLEGSVRKADNRLRVTAQLINPADGSHLWSQVYDRSIDDIFTIQEDIARTVASALKVSIAARTVGDGGTRNFAAYDAFIAGLASANSGGADNVLSSITSLKRAADIDPEFIAAWEALAAAYQLASIDIPQRRLEWQAKLIETEDRILALAPTSPAAILLVAQREITGGNLLAGERLFNSLRELAPGYSGRYISHGTFLLNVGRTHDAIALFQRGKKAEPLALAPSLWLQIAYELAGSPQQAEAEFQRALGFADETRAIRTMALIRALERRDSENIERELLAQIAVAPLTRPLNELMLHRLEDPPLARAELRKQLDEPANANSNVIVMMIAAWAAYFGDPELAVQASAQLPPITSNAFNWTVWRPLQQPMRALPEFKRLVRDWGVLEYWQASGSWGDYCRPEGDDDFNCAQGLTVEKADSDRPGE